ncbi:MAG TPA: hypothetical protein PKC88_16590, partial [Plasticicumulans sp.]|nr:hypothetical protein [Plasticicumulans sp.]
HEATLGGPIARERAWFFTALRAARQSVPQTLRETGIGVLQRDRAYRVEAKATLAPAAGFAARADVRVVDADADFAVLRAVLTVCLPLPALRASTGSAIRLLTSRPAVRRKPRRCGQGSAASSSG